MQLDKLTLQQQVKHVMQSSPTRDVLLAMAKRIELLEGRPHGPVAEIVEAFKGKRKKHEDESGIDS